MGVFARWITNVLNVINIVTFSPFDSNLGHQTPLVQPVHHEHTGKTPVFVPPSAPDGSPFVCEYPDMKDWKNCTNPQSRGCWLRHRNGTEFNITTDYELLAPKGITRNYTLDVINGTIYPDGYRFTEGKLFNGSYPGPWLQACWGDTINVTVRNFLPYNGTTIHWHGIRQHGSLQMDGVSGVTQCPIAPNDQFSYVFNTTQYGTTWYHSHYSLQYADGLLGPLTIYGPSSANYDSAVEPILMTDWLHRSAFEDFYLEMAGRGQLPASSSMLLNGIGNYTCNSSELQIRDLCRKPPQKYTTVFEEGKKYLLRLINTSTDTTWIFSIDNHNIQVIGADFVPIKPYVTNLVLVGIGQRYHVIVEATRPLPDSNYWIRMTPADGCTSFVKNFNATPEMGIVRYDVSDTSLPTTSIQKFPTACSDEHYESLIPVVPWKIGPPANEQRTNTFQVGLQATTFIEPWGNVSRWELGQTPLHINFSDPTILQLHQAKKWDVAPELAELAVVDEKVVTRPDSWIYLLITSTNFPTFAPSRTFVPARHPIHLHGHDFAIIAQSDEPYWDGLVKMNRDNPPRRDVALLPANGYLIIAFKADNPGVWLMHCHIAWHVSSGLAFQILERESDIPALKDPWMIATNETCKNWNKWYDNKANWFNASDSYFQDDSGV